MKKFSTYNGFYLKMPTISQQSAPFGGIPNGDDMPDFSSQHELKTANFERGVEYDLSPNHLSTKAVKHLSIMRQHDKLVSDILSKPKV